MKERPWVECGSQFRRQRMGFGGRGKGCETSEHEGSFPRVEPTSNRLRLGVEGLDSDSDGITDPPSRVISLTKFIILSTYSTGRAIADPTLAGCRRVLAVL